MFAELIAASLMLHPTNAHDNHWVEEKASAERELLFKDEFDGGALDRDKWIAIGPEFWVNNEQQVYVDSPETIQFVTGMEGAEDGALVLKPKWAPGTEVPDVRTADFISGRIETKGKWDFTYGRAEARIKMTDHVGVWPAWWLLGNGKWPETGEIDIMEYVGEKDWIGVAIHGPGYSGDKAPVNRHYFKDGEDVTGWHVYAVEWTADEMVFYVNDEVVYRATRRTVGWLGGDWRFDNPKHLILNFAVGGVYPAKVNMIEEPYYGLPQESVDAIKAGEAAMYVDWVRVYAPVEEQPEPTTEY
ncbi:glycoside hydrolase family 16 protein [Sphingomicrobium marinum]|uniref:glycoside hydrolase family 16 protein n=1 Tax=Sphingomicrobium marinum TaxID=1227950 RepID=UPI002240A378|nr:glycoside hydrolase family 16 protein [Sphingomicrobium marinum]